jgi:hypothetical protein
VVAAGTGSGFLYFTGLVELLGILAGLFGIITCLAILLFQKLSGGKDS